MYHVAFSMLADGWQQAAGGSFIHTVRITGTAHGNDRGTRYSYWGAVDVDVEVEVDI